MAHLGLGALPFESAAPSGAPCRRLKPRAALLLGPVGFRRSALSQPAPGGRLVRPPSGAPRLPRACLRGTPAGAAPHPAKRTPLEAPPSGWDKYVYIPITKESQVSRFQLFAKSRGSSGLTMRAKSQECLNATFQVKMVDTKVRCQRLSNLTHDH
jgi:hypothetical protein